MPGPSAPPMGAPASGSIVLRHPFRKSNASHQARIIARWVDARGRRSRRGARSLAFFTLLTLPGFAPCTTRFEPTRAIKFRHLSERKAMIKVTARPGEPGDRLLQRFKRICVREGVFREIKRRKFYEKPSDRERRKQKEAVRALRKRLQRQARRSRRAV